MKTITKVIVTIFVVLNVFNFTNAQNTNYINVSAANVENFLENACTLPSYLKKPLKRGNRGDSVRQLQNYLYEKGYLKVGPNGNYGPSTVAAVKNYQRSNNLVVTGLVGNVSLEHMRLNCGKGMGIIKNTVSTQPQPQIFCPLLNEYFQNQQSYNDNCRKYCSFTNSYMYYGSQYGFDVECKENNKTCPSGSVIPISQTCPTTTQIPEYKLQSSFFRNDITAQSILLGNSFGVRNDIRPDGTLSVQSFSLKFMNGLRQVGYSGTSGLSLLSPPTDPAPIIWLNKFQKINSINKSENISSVELIKLDKLMFAREAVDAQLATLLPIAITPTSPNEPTPNHISSLLVSAFKALPANLFKWDSNNLATFIKLQGSGVRGAGVNGGAYIYTDRGACLLIYSDSLDSQCNSTHQNVNPNTIEDDFSLVYHTLHEYAHYLDSSLYVPDGGITNKGIINTDEFNLLSFDTSTICDTNSGWRYFNLIRLGNESNEFVTNYSIGGSILGKDGCRSSAEDFAESFAMYITQGNVFRKLAETKPIIAQKYTWLKNNVFAGKEYFKGNANNISDTMQLLNKYSSPYILLPFYIDYLTVDENFVWDYAL